MTTIIIIGIIIASLGTIGSIVLGLYLLSSKSTKVKESNTIIIYEQYVGFIEEASFLYKPNLKRFHNKVNKGNYHKELVYETCESYEPFNTF